MKEKMAFRYKTAKTGEPVRYKWTEWRDGVTKEVMLREVKRAEPFIVQVVRLHPNGEGNQLWQWKKLTGWQEVTGQRNWYADNCDPTEDTSSEEAKRRAHEEVWGKPLNLKTEEEFHQYRHEQYGDPLPKSMQKKNRVRFLKLEEVGAAFHEADLIPEEWFEEFCDGQL